MLQPSQNCLDLIKIAEGLRLTPYLDLAGFWTVGYGHKLTSAELAAGGHSHSIDPGEAYALLIEDADDACNRVQHIVSASLTQGQLDALTDFVFNLGGGRLAGSTLLKLLNAGDYAAAGQELLKWDMAAGVQQPGLTARRKAELAMWETA